MKVIVSSGEEDEAVKDLIGNKVLGYSWDASKDVMAVKFVMHLNNKRGSKVRSSPALTKDTLGVLESSPITKRIGLKICNGILDFMGLSQISCPFTVRFRMLMRELYEGANKELKYDDKVPDEVLQSWKD